MLNYLEKNKTKHPDDCYRVKWQGRKKISTFDVSLHWKHAFETLLSACVDILRQQLFVMPLKEKKVILCGESTTI